MVSGWNREFGRWVECGLIQELPVRLVQIVDLSRGYEMERMTVFEMPGGQYMTARESGCSCYDAADAQIEFHPTAGYALATLQKYQKEIQELRS